MTALAIPSQFGLFDRLESPTAGSEAKKLKKSVVKAFESLKGDGARTSWVFQDLQNLAHEYGKAVHQSPVFGVAQRFLLAMPGSIAIPELDVDQDGEVVFDWRGSFSRMMTIALREDGRVSYAAHLSSTRTRYGEDQFVDAIPSEILELVRQVTQHYPSA
jgi:hypothetical protein